jgi:hypothetical protein
MNVDWRIIMNYSEKVLLWGVLGSALIILSEFLDWSLGFSAYITAVYYDDSYFFPLIGGILALIGVMIGFFAPKKRIAGILIQFFGLSILLIFLFDYMANNWIFLPNAQLGVYLYVTGIFLTFIEVIWLLTIFGKKQ